MKIQITHTFTIIEKVSIEDKKNHCEEFYEENPIVGLIPAVNLRGEKRDLGELRKRCVDSLGFGNYHLLKSKREEFYVVFRKVFRNI